MTSKIILGTVQFGLDYGINNAVGKVKKDEVFDILDEAYNRNVKVLDSAKVYGDAHSIIGLYHNNRPRNKFQIITKLPHEFNSANVEKEILEYCKELDVERLNTLMFHSYDSYKKNETILEKLFNLKTIGLIEKLGVSVYDNLQAENVIKVKGIDLIQLPFNLLDNRSLRGNILKFAKNEGKEVHTRSAFLQGLFFIDRKSSVKHYNSLKNEISELDKISSDFNIPLQKLSLAYCLNQPEIDKVLIGVDGLNQLKNNLEIVDYPNLEQAFLEINKIKIVNENLLNPSKWN